VIPEPSGKNNIPPIVNIKKWLENNIPVINKWIHC
jgi:hypothetical protein